MSVACVPVASFITSVPSAMRPSAKRFFCKTLNAGNSQTSPVINADKQAAYLSVFATLQQGKTLP
ncbi:MAG TPA: hypothetical protein V6D03_01530 [Candidatus Caenarcaniphilales bacterium]